MLSTMQKTFVLLLSLCWLSACNTDQSKTTTPETGSNQTSVLREGELGRPPASAEETAKADETKEQTTDINHLIVPGKSIGLLKLNEQAEVIQKLLGKPDKADAAMGKSLQTWYADTLVSKAGRPVYETDIFFVRNMGSADESSRAKQIRITSPEFKLERGIGVNTALETIQAQFPEAIKTATYTSPQNRETVSVYHDKNAGIAFEIAKTGKCIGIGIQEAGKSNFEVYTAFATDFKRL